MAKEFQGEQNLESESDKGNTSLVLPQMKKLTSDDAIPNTITKELQGEQNLESRSDEGNSSLLLQIKKPSEAVETESHPLYPYLKESGSAVHETIAKELQGKQNRGSESDDANTRPVENGSAIVPLQENSSAIVPPQEDNKNKMEDMRQVAIAHYKVGSSHAKTLAKKFFEAMDNNGDGQISLREFSVFMSQEGHAGVDHTSFFQALDRDGNGTLDFWEVLTLYYIVKSGRPFCKFCGVFVTKVYFTCVDCFESPSGTFCLCLDCYPTGNWTHDHKHFLDNYTLLEVKRVSAMNQRNQPSNASYNIAPAPTIGTHHVQTSNALVPVQQGNNNSQLRAAFKAFETAISIGSLGASVATLCTIL